jgi:ketosteroid isomerase-like protein
MNPTFARCALIALLLAAGGCEQQPDPPEPGFARQPAETRAYSDPVGKSDAAHKIESALLAWNLKRWDELLEVFAPEAELILTDSTQEPLRGRQQIQAMLKGLALAFPDLHAQPVRILDSGDGWLAEILVTGTQLGEFLEQPVSQRRVGCQLAVFAWVRDQKIHKAIVCGNPLAVVRQIQAPEGDRRWLPPAPIRSERVEGSGSTAQVEAVKAFFQTFETGDLAALTSQVHEDVVVYAFGDGKRLDGLDALRLTLVREREAFEGEIAVEHAIAAGPYVGAIVQVRGSLKTDVGPLKATGRHFAERGIDVFRFEGGKIQEWDNYRNLLDLMRQLGLWPPQPPAGANP